MSRRKHIAVIGKTGQLARALKTEINDQGHRGEFFDRAACDLSKTPEEIQDFVRLMEKPDALIIAAAYTGVDAAETDRETAMAVNAVAPAAIAKVAAKRGIPLVYISTDYVFNGTVIAPYPVDAEIDPVNYYGVTKALGESGVLAAGGNAAVIRTSWVYDSAGKNFVTTMLRLAQSRKDIDIVSDQIGRPTYAPDLAKAVMQCADGLINNRPEARGIFHVTNSGEPVNWADFAKAIFDIFADDIPHKVKVNSILTSDYPTPAARPLWSVMELTRFERNFKAVIPHWLDGLKRAKLERSH